MLCVTWCFFSHILLQTGWLTVTQHNKQLPVEPLSDRPRISSFPADGPLSLGSGDRFLLDDLDLLLLSHAADMTDRTPEGRPAAGAAIPQNRDGENVHSRRQEKTDNAPALCPPFVFKAKLQKPLRKGEKAVLEVAYVMGKWSETARFHNRSENPLGVQVR